MRTKQVICVDCGANGTVERRRCADCFKKHNRARASIYYSNLRARGGQRNRYGKMDCVVCGEMLLKNRANQIAHGRCRRKSRVVYNDLPRSKKGHMVARQMVIDGGYKIDKRHAVHHMDENPLHNMLDNFMILTNSHHLSLHIFLENQWLITKQIKGGRAESEWIKIVVAMNFVWAKTKNIKVVVVTTKTKIEFDQNKVYVFDTENKLIR